MAPSDPAEPAKVPAPFPPTGFPGAAVLTELAECTGTRDVVWTQSRVGRKLFLFFCQPMTARFKDRKLSLVIIIPKNERQAHKHLSH